LGKWAIAKPSQTHIIANWNAVPNATHYEVEKQLIGTDSAYIFVLAARMWRCPARPVAEGIRLILTNMAQLVTMEEIYH